MGEGGYQNLLVYRAAVTIHDLTVIFCDRFYSDLKYKRTVEQMVQAARSGKQNIVEGSLEKSMASNITLTGVGRASFGELLEDFKDYLRQNGLRVWAKEDPRVSKIRLIREDVKNETNLTHLADLTGLDFSKGEVFANLMVCLIHKENYMLDKLLQAQEEKFVKEGGFRENLFKKRKEYLGNKK